jgi:hypothetical protein
MGMTIKSPQDAIERSPATKDRRPKDSGVWTSSALRKYWLVWFRGYTVSQTHIEPRNNLFNEIIYRKRWYLVRRNHRQR